MEEYQIETLRHDLQRKSWAAGKEVDEASRPEIGSENWIRQQIAAGRDPSQEMDRKRV